MSEHAAGKQSGHSGTFATQLAKKHNRTAEFRKLTRGSSSSSVAATSTRDIYNVNDAKNQQEKDSLLKRKNADAEWIAEARRVVRPELLEADYLPTHRLIAFILPSIERSCHSYPS